ncbi:MAG: nitrous oxide reductase family maturation protein NosD [Promethearchaeota archaeon]
MKKIKIILLILITFFVVTPFINNNLSNNLRNVEENKLNYNSNNTRNRVKNLKTSKYWENIKFIHITGANWSNAVTYDWCSGSGTFNNPYVIENVTIDAGGSGSGILIENSTAYFRIENCTIYNSGSKINIVPSYLEAGIKLVNVSNGDLINNNLSFNNRNGIYLEYSSNNTISGNTCNDNDQFGIWLYCSDNNSLSVNTANKNDYGIYLNGNYNNISRNIANNNDRGIGLSLSNNNTVTGNIVINNTYGISLTITHNNTVSGNTLIGNVFFIENYRGITNIIKDNTCYTKILPTGIHGFEIEPYGVKDINISIIIALENETEVIFSAFNDTILDTPLDNGLIFMNLQLNDTNNINQSIEAPINITLKCDFNKYEKIEALWFNETANGGQGAWEQILFVNIDNSSIIISVNHTSIFFLSGKLKSFPLPSNNGNAVNVVDDINMIFVIILIVLICSLIIIAASSTHYFKPKNQRRTKLIKKETLMKKPLVKSIDMNVGKTPNLKGYVKKKNLLRILKNKNVLENPTLFRDLKFNALSNEFWEKIDILELDENDFKDFINDMLSLTPKEREEIINGMLKLRELDSDYSNQQEYFG